MTMAAASVGRLTVAALLTAVAVHVAIVLAAPTVIMDRAMQRVGEAGTRVNVWRHAPRMTPETQPIVRPSPDLAYSACVFDLRDGPLHITAPGWDGYASLSLYGANTDTFLTLSSPGGDELVADILLVGPEAKPPTQATAARVVSAPSERGIAILRYRAPTAAEFARADAARLAAVCTRVGG